MKKPAVSVIMPALNEQKNIASALQNTLAAFDDLGLAGEIVCVNDGSGDETGAIMAQWADKDGRVRVLTHGAPQGVGASFWDGVDHASGEAVVMLPGDNENDPWEILQYHELLDSVDMVIPFVFNKQARSLFRNALSLAYRFIINTTFLVYFNYTNGTVMYRRSILQELDYRSQGFFFQTDILIRLQKRGYLFAEVPYRLGQRSQGVSKAVTFPSFVQVAQGYLKLVHGIYADPRGRMAGPFARGSQTERRHNEAGRAL